MDRQNRKNLREESIKKDYRNILDRNRIKIEQIDKKSTKNRKKSTDHIIEIDLSTFQNVQCHFNAESKAIFKLIQNCNSSKCFEKKTR